MGEVYRARDSKLNRDVAIKVLPPLFANDAERLVRFEREARLLAQLHHPSIASIFGLEESGGMHALVMELVEGPTLAERLESGPLALEECLSIARQIAEALEEAHEKGIVHRDLKPQNVKVTVDGKVKVLDFGLAKAMDPSASGHAPAPELGVSPTLPLGATMQGVILGTATYMSPEQARGRPVDKRADIWAFGVVLYEMLTGNRLFAGDSVIDTLSAVMRQEIDLKRLPAATPPRLRELVRRCLERDSGHRLRDIGEARIVLEDVQKGAAGPAAERVSERRFSRARAALLALSSIVAGLLGWWIHGRLLRPEVVEPIRVQALTFSGKDSEPAASPDSNLVAFTSWRDGVSRIWIKQLVGGGEAPLTSGPDRHPRFSPDGSSILFLRDLGSTQAVYRVGLIGGEPRKLVDDASEADWSPDGRKIVFLRTHGATLPLSSLGVYDVESGGETVIATHHARELVSARWSPDGQTILYTTGQNGSANWQLFRLDVASGRVTAIPPGQPSSAVGGLAWSGAGQEFFFIQAATILGDIAGSRSRVIRCDARTGKRTTVLWGDGLAALNSAVGEVSRCDVLAPGRLVFGELLRRQNLREVALAGPAVAAPRLLAEGSSTDRQPTYSADGQRILFSSNRGGALDLWTIDRASGALRQITDNHARDWDPAFTPDGKQVLWDSDRGGHLEIWLANADGSPARQLTQDGLDAENPTQTRDGKWIVYWSGNAEKRGVWKIHPDGSGAKQLLSASAVATDVSPDGRYVLFIEQNRTHLQNTIRFVEIESGSIVPFTIAVTYRLGSPAVIWGRARWWPDGRSIAFVGEDERGLSGVFVQDFAPGRDTTATRRPLAGFSNEYVTESLGISPDGSRLTISTGQESASIMVAEGVPGAMPPVRRPP